MTPYVLLGYVIIWDYRDVVDRLSTIGFRRRNELTEDRNEIAARIMKRVASVVCLRQYAARRLPKICEA